MSDRSRAPRKLVIILVVLAALLISVAVPLVWLAGHAELLLRARLIKTLSDRFHSPVELDTLHISVLAGLQVEGTGLRILHPVGSADPPAAPLFTIRSFQFHTGVRALFQPVPRVATVHIQGAELHIPSREARAAWMSNRSTPADTPPGDILVDKLIFDDLKLLIETRMPGKVPLEFDVANLTLRNVSRRQPFDYDATLRNPKPVGDVRSTGHFGPWQSDSPRDTPIDGGYAFTHADLSTIKGIGGILSSKGAFAGLLGHIVVDGTSDTPDFRLTTAEHPLPLHTRFHAIVDGTTGDTYLRPVDATLQHSHIVATGSVTRKPGVPGHDVELNVLIDRGRIEDFLALAVRTSPAILRGALAAKARIAIPPGPGTVPRRMRLSGSFSIQQATFSSPGLQQQIAKLSERALGWPEKANPQQAAPVVATLDGSFELTEEQVTVPRMAFNVPGIATNVEGQYGLDGKTLDFQGTVRTQATASEMVGGWKSLLVMPFDNFLKKRGAGVEVPFKVGGTPSDPKLALDFDRLGHRQK